MDKKKRRRFSALEKLQIVREGMQKEVKISNLCQHYNIYPTEFYKWKKQMEEAILKGFDNKDKSNKMTKKEIQLTKENEDLKAVIVELSQMHVELKKKVYGQT
jgi:transposase